MLGGPFAYREEEFKQHFQSRVLTLLLKKYEAGKSFASGEPSKAKARISFRNGPFTEDYEDEMDFRKKEWMNEVVMHLGELGIVTYKWEKYQEGRQLASVSLEPDQVDAAYELAAITPKLQKMEALRRILAELTDHPWQWVSDWALNCVQALENRKSSGLDLDDPAGYEQLVKVLRVLPGIDDEIPKRVLSQRLYQDTKVFERQVERRLVQLIQSHSEGEFESDAEALASVGIADHPAFVRIFGPLLFTLDGAGSISLGAFSGGVGLSRDTVRDMEVMDVPAERVILIENLTTWHQWVSERKKADELVIYTGGYPNRSVQLLFRKIGAYLAQRNSLLPMYHWGDMDVGGIRIYEFIRENYFPQLAPLFMDEPTYEQHAGAGMEIHLNYMSKIQALLEDGRFARWHGLLERMRKHCKRIEQESIGISLGDLHL